MKRRHSIERALKMRHWDPPYFIPKSIIPPCSVIRLSQHYASWGEGSKIGDTFRIGYYSKQDGPNVVWLVDAAGQYTGTWDQRSLLDTFEVVSLSNETDIYGCNRARLEPTA